MVSSAAISSVRLKARMRFTAGGNAVGLSEVKDYG